MKKLYGYLCLLLSATLFISCSAISPTMTLAVCGSYAVPGMFTAELKGNHYSCEILEEDDYGRVLFEFKGDSVLSGNEETAVVICQKYDEEYVFFLEDRCYCLNPSDPSDVDQLKQENAWNKPLELEKMSRRQIRVSSDLFLMTESSLSISKITNLVCYQKNIAKDQIKELCFVDEDSHGNVMYYLCVEEHEEYAYFLIVNDSYDMWFMEITDCTVDPAQVAELKQNASWHYGTQ